MAPLPQRPSIDYSPQPRFEIDLADDSTDVIGAIASETGRDVLRALGDGPATASEIAERADTSLQNVHYHLDNLCEAGLVTTPGTWYSVKGREMTVYALTGERIELHIGRDAPSDTADTGCDDSSPVPHADDD